MLSTEHRFSANEVKPAPQNPQPDPPPAAVPSSPSIPTPPPLQMRGTKRKSTPPRRIVPAPPPPLQIKGTPPPSARTPVLLQKVPIAPPPLQRKGTPPPPRSLWERPVLLSPPPLTLHPDPGQPVKVPDKQFQFKSAKSPPVKVFPRCHHKYHGVSLFQEIPIGFNGSPEINSERARWEYNVKVGFAISSSGLF